MRGGGAAPGGEAVAAEMKPVGAGNRKLGPRPDTRKKKTVRPPPSSLPSSSPRPFSLHPPPRQPPTLLRDPATSVLRTPSTPPPSTARSYAGRSAAASRQRAPPQASNGPGRQRREAPRGLHRRQCPRNLGLLCCWCSPCHSCGHKEEVLRSARVLWHYWNYA